MISVVIPAYNEEKLLPLCLNALLRQDSRLSFEVIVVDNGSTDNTVTIAKQYSKTLPLRILIEKKKGRGAARRRGFQSAKGSIILSTDADSVVPDNWIRSMIELFRDRSLVAITGTCIIDDCSPFTNFFFNTFFQISTEFFYRFVHGHWCLIGPNFAIRKTVYVDSGGFDRHLNCREDADLSERVSSIGTIKKISLPVVFSGRRYRKGLFTGAFPYVKNQILEIFRGRSQSILADIR